MVTKRDNKLILDNKVIVDLITPPVCIKCKKKLPIIEVCNDCRAANYSFETLIALGYYIPEWWKKDDVYTDPSIKRSYDMDKVNPKYRFSKMINDAKSRSNLSIPQKKDYIEILCKGLSWKIKNNHSGILDELNLLVHVPKWDENLPNSFNHGYFYAEYLSRELNINFDGTILIENKDYHTNPSISRFSISPSADIKGDCIMIVDDVFTNAITKGPISNLLTQKGASKIYIGVIARASRS